MGLESGIAGAHHVRQDAIKASTYMSYLCQDPLAPAPGRVAFHGPNTSPTESLLTPDV